MRLIAASKASQASKASKVVNVGQTFVFNALLALLA
jgi:hypothetical protein